MPAEPVPADSGRDEDLAWLDRDPERDCWPGRAREHDEPPLDEEYEDHEPLTGEELAEIGEAAADELLAVEAATTGRRASTFAITPVTPGAPSATVSTCRSWMTGIGRAAVTDASYPDVTDKG